MFDVACHVGRIDGSSALHPNGLNYDRVTRIFLKNSRRRDPAGDINLSFHYGRQQFLQNVALRYVSSLSLHTALRRLAINNPRLRRAHQVGLIIAHRFAYRPNVYGVMFDRGFRTADDRGRQPVDAANRAVPREGCAIFLGPIAEAPNAEDETLLTVVHELGHVFNLVEGQGNTYMRGVNHRMPMPMSFHEHEQRWLSSCSVSSSVWPGGSTFRGRVSSRRGTSSWRFRVKLTRSEVFRFEPFELEIQLTWPSSQKSRTWIPDCIDPGYESFRIRIRDPNGDVRRFVPPNHYCGGRGRISFKPGDRFQRDISLFGQAGGYTFDQPGEYTIWAELDLAGITLKSNTVNLQVLQRNSDARRIEFLESARIARILYYREATPRSRSLYELRQFAEQASSPSAAHAAYAVGCCFVRALKGKHGTVVAERLRRKAYDFLARARDSQNLGGHARNKAVQMIQDLD